MGRVLLTRKMDSPSPKIRCTIVALWSSKKLKLRARKADWPAQAVDFERPALVLGQRLSSSSTSNSPTGGRMALALANQNSGERERGEEEEEEGRVGHGSMRLRA
ncbi:unnamed protein product [Prorocentrum cordatum]|uniref:Anaphase-promoting complex subunit 1 n=1 Tax=Prorocentrum cordatum TaxID=2364126 RepID=A0ABN9PRU6_9DINO|nr:unnamed protein product [Polarella glacialis]